MGISTAYPNLAKLFEPRESSIPTATKKWCGVARKALFDVADLLKGYTTTVPLTAPENSGSSYIRQCHHYYSSPYGWSFWPSPNRYSFFGDTIHTTHVHHHHPESDEKKKKKKEERDNTLYILAGVAAAGIGMVTAYLIGIDLGARQDLLDAKELIKEHQIAQTDLKDETATQYSKILEDTKTFLDKRNREAMRRLAAKVALFAGALLMLAGSFATSPALVGAGAIVAFVAASGWLVEKGFEEGYRAKTQRADEIARRAKDLYDQLG